MHFRHSLQRTSSLLALAFSSRSVFFVWFPSTDYFDTQGLQAAKDASVSQDKLIELFSRIERFFGRREIYIGITPTAAMMDIIIEIMVEILTVLGIATKEVKRGRLSEQMSRRLTILD
jgi:hypothetical protein